MNQSVFLTSYGNESGKDRGIIELKFSGGSFVRKSLFPLNGKSNMVINAGHRLITSVQDTIENYLIIMDEKGNEVRRITTEYFYSYGQALGHDLLLASFESGVDTLIDLRDGRCENVQHTRPGYTCAGRSHYIHKIRNDIISVDNALQRIYIYSGNNLKEYRTLDFKDENIRLISTSPEQDYIYLNTEISNELIVLNSASYSVVNRIKLTDRSGVFSGGNACSSDGKYVCVSLRGEDSICVMKMNASGGVKEQTKFLCGKMPRDLMILGHALLVSCTESDCVQAFDLDSGEMITQVGVCRPITFALN